MSEIKVRNMSDYNAKLLELLEQAEGKNPYAHLDTAKYPLVTIGIGFNIDDDISMRNKVFKEFNITNGDLKDDLSDIIDKRLYKPLFGDEKLILPANFYQQKTAEQNRIRNELAGKIRDALDHVIANQKYQSGLNTKKDQFEFKSITAMEDFCKNEIISEYEKRVTKTLKSLGLKDSDYPKSSYERMVLFDLRYNGVAINKKGMLATALVEKNRAKFWAALRYWTCPNGSQNGVYIRRLFESTMFGLYNDPKNVTIEEAENIYNLFKNKSNKDWIYNRDKEYSKNNRINDAIINFGRFLPEGEKICNLQKSFLQAADKLIELRTGRSGLNIGTYKIDGQVVISSVEAMPFDRKLSVISSTSNHFQNIGSDEYWGSGYTFWREGAFIGDGGGSGETAAGGSGEGSDTSQFDQKLIKQTFNYITEKPIKIGSSNDLLLGMDSDHNLIEGKNGNDVLIGGIRSDMLLGGNGNDILIGMGSKNEVIQNGTTQQIICDYDVLNGGSGFDTYYAFSNDHIGDLHEGVMGLASGQIFFTTLDSNGLIDVVK
jgi:hypothetical protein